MNKKYQLNNMKEALIESFLEFDASLITEKPQAELLAIAQLDKAESAGEWSDASIM